MSAPRYEAATAAADLAAAGLLAGVLVARDGVLAAARPGDAAGAFRGAGLDSRRLAPESLFVALAGEHADGRRFAPDALAAGHWVLTRTADDPAHPPLKGSSAAAGSGVLLSDDPVAALGRLGACWRARRPAAVAGVTGTNGKTTTKDLLAALLSGAGPVLATRGNLNNHLGVPLTLLDLDDAHAHAVVEMGASAVGEIAALAALVRPRVGIITNASPAHLAAFGSLEGIVAGKGELVAALPPDGTAVLNADSPGFDAWRARATAPVVSFGERAGDHRWRWRPASGGGTLELDGEAWPVPLPGAHNGANLAAAVLAGRALGVPDAALRRGLAAFTGSPHRGVLRTLHGRTFLDDAYNANPRSVAAAVRTLLELPGGEPVAVLGVMAELGSASGAIHDAVGRELAEAGLPRLLTVGEAARALGTGFAAAGGRAAHRDTHEEAAAWLAAHTVPGDRVLVKGSRSATMERTLEIFAARGGDR